MATKRPHQYIDLTDSPPSSTPSLPAKRRQVSQGVHARSTSLAYSSSPLARTAPSSPFDSPSNPFGRKYASTLSRSTALPVPSSFSKHYPLRFTIVTDDNDADVYRVVQVPLNYTFYHLRQLLLYLFGGAHVASPGGHLFEAQKEVVLIKEDGGKSTGIIERGKTWIKLSNVRDPYRVSDLAKADPETDTDAEWRWENEDEFTLAQLWQRERTGFASKAIIYHHDVGPSTRLQVHITVHTSKLPSRKGIGNKPFIFSANGVFALPSSLPFPTTKASRAPRKKATTIRTLHKDQVHKWNKSDGFSAFLARSRPREEQTSEAEESTSTEADVSQSSAFSDPFDYAPETPFPPVHSMRARRVDGVGRRLENLTKKGLEKVAALAEKEGDDYEDQEYEELSDDVSESEAVTAVANTGREDP